MITDAWNLFLYSKNSTVNMILLHVKKDHFPYGVSAQILLLLKDPKLFLPITRELNTTFNVWKCLKTIMEKSPLLVKGNKVWPI